MFAKNIQRIIKFFNSDSAVF